MAEYIKHNGPEVVRRAVKIVEYLKGYDGTGSPITALVSEVWRGSGLAYFWSRYTIWRQAWDMAVYDILNVKPIARERPKRKLTISCGPKADEFLREARKKSVKSGRFNN